MSTVGSKSSSSRSVTPLENLLFDYPEADIILRSFDSYEFRVLKLYIVDSSPKLSEKLLISSNPRPTSPTTPAEAHDRRGENVDGLPVVSLPVSGAILSRLLTYVFPVPPVLPQTVEQTMELLSVAQEYEMDTVLTHIRNHVALQTPSYFREETALDVYTLAQRYGLRTEALQAAKSTLRFLDLTIWNLHLVDELGMMPGAALHELWKYHQRVRSKIKSDLEEFMTLRAHEVLGNSTCGSLTESGVPSWLYDFIVTIGTDPVPLASLDLTELYVHMADHIQTLSHQGGGGCPSCADTRSVTIGRFWEALTTVVDHSVAEAETSFMLIDGEGKVDDQVKSSSDTHPPLKYSDMPNADVILQSSDLVKFHVHRAVLVTSSPFFRDMFSLPQPSNDETPGELPIVPVPEDAAVLNSLISMLYPVPRAIPKSSDAILALLSAAQKYDMVTVQSSIRAEASRRLLLSPPQAEVFHMYAIACSRRLIPEMEAAARITLDYPLTFEGLGVALRSFEGWALRDLAEFRMRCASNLHSQLMSLLDERNGPSKIWVGCPTALSSERLPGWLESLLRMKLEQAFDFTCALPTPLGLCKAYFGTLQIYIDETDCRFCMKVHALKGEAFCSMIKKKVAEARNVPYPSSERAPGV